MTDFISTIRHSITQNNLLSSEAVVIVALSGGADSVALLSALSRLGHHCIAAHCNFKLRGEESDRDQRHAAEIATRLGAEFVVTEFNTTDYASSYGISIEMAARDLRYKWFEQLRQQYSAEAIAVAHHRDDNIETFFLNLIRGTGIAGLTAMSPRRDYIIRPMLDVTRTDVIEYLHNQNLDYVTDSTNTDCDYKRNKIRNIILPLLREQFPNADNAIAHTIACLQSNEAIYRDAIDKAAIQYINDSKIALTEIIDNSSAPATLLFELIRPYGFNYAQANDIIASAHNSGSRIFAPSYTALIDRGCLLITPLSESEVKSEYIISLKNDISEPIHIRIDHITPHGNLSGLIVGAKNHTIMLDNSVTDGNPVFKLRKWKQSDRIAPFGMRGTKKVSDIFSDSKLSLNDKQSTWILTRNDEILWIVGLRASRLFPITDRSTGIIRLSID